MNVEFLNMFTVNRLCAIIKMLQYCQDKHMDPKDFMDGRTYHKIRAHLKQIVELGSDPAEKNTVCPSLEEIQFILTIEKDQLDHIIDILKNSLIVPYNSIYFSVYDDKLNQISIKNKSLMERIQTRINEERRSTNIMPSNEMRELTLEKTPEQEEPHKRLKIDDSNSETEIGRAHV